MSGTGLLPYRAIEYSATSEAMSASERISPGTVHRNVRKGKRRRRTNAPAAATEAANATTSEVSASASKTLVFSTASARASATSSKSTVQGGNAGHLLVHLAVAVTWPAVRGRAEDRRAGRATRPAPGYRRRTWPGSR